MYFRLLFWKKIKKAEKYTAVGLNFFLEYAILNMFEWLILP